MATLANTEAVESPKAASGFATELTARFGGLLALTACAAVACLPFAVAHLRLLSSRPHYQFYPLAILAAGVVAAVRFRHFRPQQVGAGPVTGATLGTALVGLLAATALDSSWLGYLSLLVAATGLVYGAAGREGLVRAAPALALLALILPPPFDLDREAVYALRRLTTRWSGLLLDAMHVPHLMAGNVVELGSRRMLVEEACSGINSLFALLASALFLAALFGRSLAHTVLLLAATAFWVIVANVLRVVAIVLAERRGLDLTDGWRHEAISVALFVVALLLMASTDCLFRLVSVWRAGRRPGRTLPDGPPAPESAEPTARRGDFCWPRNVTYAVAAAFLVTAGAYWTLHGAPANAAPTKAVTARLDRLEAEVLPDRIEGWRRVDFRTEQRNPGSEYGEFSRIWTYRLGGLTAQACADYPFQEWHDLSLCYRMQGWVVRDEKVIALPAGTDKVVEVAYEKAGFRAGYLLYGEFDAAGRPLEARLGGAGMALHRQQGSLARIAHRLGLAASPASEGPPTDIGQLQLWIAGEGPLTDEQRSAAQTLFARAYAAVRKELANPE